MSFAESLIRIMSDREAVAELRSAKVFVVVEAAAGCGKTFQGAALADHLAGRPGGRVLVLTHTHAAANAFSERCSERASRVEVRTIDSLYTEMASAYHVSLGLPEDAGTWASQTPDGYSKQAELVERLLTVSKAPALALASRYSAILFDEHQDASSAQAALATALRDVGGVVRVFGDPMQGIYDGVDAAAPRVRWAHLLETADSTCSLSTPHRWQNGREELGAWILEARETLKAGGTLRLSGTLPRGLTVIRADNVARGYGQYRTTAAEGAPIRSAVRAPGGALVLSSHNATVGALRAYFGRTIPIWEGQVRNHLDTLVGELEEVEGDPAGVAAAVVNFLEAVCTGFQRSRFGKRLIQEAARGARGNRRGLPKTLQALAGMLVAQPDHRGAAKLLRSVAGLVRSDPAFGEVKLDLVREFWDATRLGDQATPTEGAAALARRRTWARPAMPESGLSTVHKAKGLEHPRVVVIPLDAVHFGDREKDRCLLYVAISRATRELTLVVPWSNGTPLVDI